MFRTLAKRREPPHDPDQRRPGVRFCTSLETRALRPGENQLAEEIEDLKADAEAEA
jgi:hypothetical protein